VTTQAAQAARQERRQAVPEPLWQGDCFTAALYELLPCFRDGTRPDLRYVDGLLLVHGLVTGQGRIAGIRHLHAWVETDADENGLVLVLDTSNGGYILTERAKYYHFGRVVEQQLQRYTAKEALALVLSSGHCGPWNEELEALQDV